MKKSIVEHVNGVTGQVSAALPLLLITVVLARSSGLEEAGMFIVVVGISAATFSIALWGLRTSIIRDRFQSVSPLNYVTARLLAISLACVVVTKSGLSLGLDPVLLMSLLLFRVSDAILDLDFAFDQVRRGTSTAIRTYANLQMAKVGVLLSALVIATFFPAVDLLPVYLVAAIIALGIAMAALARSLAAYSGYPDSPSVHQVAAVFRNAFWFAAAAGGCALLSAAPRISLPWFYDGVDLGVTGASLTVSTFFGMVFYTTWLRFLPRFSEDSDHRSVAIHFIRESVLVAVVLAAVSALFLPQLVAAVFGYSDPLQIEQTRTILLASIVFFVGMNMVNLFKVTAFTWMELLAYGSALAVTAQIALGNPAARQTHLMLTIAGLVMLVLGLLSLRFMSAENDEADR